MSKVFIRAGHGGQDSGAVYGGLVEKKMNLTVATEVARLLANKFDIKMCRVDDTFVDLNVGVDMANQWGADIFVSIHHNAGGGDGYEVYHSINGDAGTKLATCIANRYTALGQNPHGQGVRTRESEVNPGTDYYCEIRETNMTAIISEFAYIDSIDSQAVDTAPELLSEAGAIAHAIADYFGISIDVPVPAPIPTPAPKPVPPVSNDTLKLQQALNRLKIKGANGQPLTEDGLAGLNTTYAVRILQYIANISVDGVVGTQTWSAINSILAKPYCKVVSAPQIPTRYIQWRLGLTKDGLYGQATKAAVIAFQKAQNISADGEVGPTTWGKFIG